MDRRELDVLWARLQTVERRQRLTVAGWLVSLVLLVVLWVGAQQATSQQSVIRAREFDVVDSAGRDVVALGIDTAGLGGVWVYDAQKQTRIAIGFAGTGAGATSGVTLYNKGAKLQIGFDNLDLPGVWLYDLAGKQRTTLGFGGTEPGLWLFDAEGRNKWNTP